MSNVSFNSNGILNTVTHGNGVIDHQDIATNGMRRPKRLYTTNVAEGLDWNSGDYAYDGSGNIKQIGQSLYVYDKLSRVVQGDLVELGKTQAYDYDVYGNIQSIVTNGSPRSTPTDSSTNRLKEPSGTLFKYDPRGNLQTWGAQEFHEYDEFNLIKQVRSGSDETDPVVRAHVYTADDERLLTIGLGFDYEFSLRDLDGRLLRIFKSDPATEAWSISLDNIWLEGRLVGFVEDGSEVHAHLDHLGTPRLHTDSEGSNIATFDYFPFGELAASTGQSDVRMKFTGHERDDSTIGTAAELDYMHARYFSAHFGRFTSVDSALSSAGPGNPSSWNRYLYARGNPVVRWDPNGLIDERSIFDKAITESPSVLESALTMVNETVARNVEFGFVVDASMRTGPMATSNRPDQVDLTGQIIKHIGFNLVRETGGRLVATFHSHLAPGRHPIPGNRSKEFLLFNQLASTADSRLAHEYATPGYIVQPSMNRLIKVDAQGGPGRAILTGRDFVFWMQRARVGRALSAARARAVASALLAIPF